MSHFIEDLYIELLGNGWTMLDIDDMDLLRWLRIVWRSTQRKQPKQEIRQVAIDEIRW